MNIDMKYQYQSRSRLSIVNYAWDLVYINPLSNRKKRENEKYKKLEYRPPSLPKGFIIILSQITNLYSNLITESILGLYILRNGGFSPGGSCSSLVFKRKRVGGVSVGREKESERGFGECE